MPVPARNAKPRLERVEKLIDECHRLECVISDASLTLQAATDVLRAEIEGVSVADHKPLQELRSAGKLGEVLALLEALARRPEYTEAALELASGSGLEIVAKCLPA